MNKNEMTRQAYPGGILGEIRQMPHDAQAEEAVIGSMLVGGPEAINAAQTELTDAAFYVPAHKIIFGAIVSGNAGGMPIDLVTLTTALGDMGMLEQVGGAAAITRMFTLVPSAAALSFYAETVRDKYLLRQMIEGANTVLATCYVPTSSDKVTAKIDDAAKFFTGLALALDPRRGGLEPPSIAVPETMTELEAIHAGRGGVRGLDTGLYGLNRMTGGFKPGDVITIAARPSDGKTSLAMNIAEHVAAEEKVPVAVFSLEMSVMQLWQRLLLSRARVDMSKVRTGMMSDYEMKHLHAMAAVFNPPPGEEGAAPIYVDAPTSLLKIFELKAKARQAVLSKGVGLIIVDYIQLMVSGTKRGSENRVLEIAEITANVKLLARELKVPILMLAQLSRAAEARPNGIPRLSDLRESGSIEQDSDTVLFIHRPEKFENDEKKREELAGTANIIVAKNRNGPTSSNEGIPVVFLKNFVRFENHADEKYYSNNPAHRQRNLA